MPKVSVNIPVYNDEKYIRETLDSALNQTYSDLEIIIVDDGSTDNIKNVLENQKDNVKFKILTKILLSKLEEKIPIEYLRNIDDYKVFDITFEFNIEYYNDVVNFFNEFESDEFKLLLNIEKYNL